MHKAPTTARSGEGQMFTVSLPHAEGPRKSQWSNLTIMPRPTLYAIIDKPNNK